MSDDSAATAAATSSSSSWTMVVFMVLSFPTIVWIVAYTIPQIYMAFVRTGVPNLRERYAGAKWALVTGGGTGIGRAIAFRLASQGLNVVVVSLDDPFLKQTIEELSKQYPKQQFKGIGVNFAPNASYMDKIRSGIKETCKGDDIRIIFCNAGFMVTGFFEQAPIEKLLTNMECNATANVQLAHYFLKEMVAKKQTGCLVFTSSIAAAIPTPFAAMYASTKAFVSQLAACLHIECQPLGIDVCSIHPSPVASNFYTGLDHKVDMIENAAKVAVTPDSITGDIFKSIGCCAWRDLGSMAVGTRMGTFFLPFNFFTELFASVAPYLPDWKNHNKHR